MTAPLAAQTWLAIQQDAAAVSVDWQGLTRPDPPTSGHFDGAVFVLGPDGDYLTHLPWAHATDAAADHALTDAAADHALTEAGWHRTEAWRTDEHGRRVASIHTADPATDTGSPVAHTMPGPPRPAGGPPGPPDRSVAGRDPEQVFASIQRSIDKAGDFLNQLPSAAYYRSITTTPTTPHHTGPA